MTIQETLKTWKQNAIEDPVLLEELATLKPDTLETEDRFSQELQFGTGGLRGILGAGTNRMNIYTVRKATQGLSVYLLQKTEHPSVAIAFDTRINSERFAREAACTLAANGIKVWLYPRYTPTPSLSFAVRHLRCTAGICITASHNPAQYNGYKVYGADGCQITVEAAHCIQREIVKVDPFSVKPADFDMAQQNGYIEWIEEQVLDCYLQAVQKLSLSPQNAVPLKVVYTPLHGAGLECVTRALQSSGVEVVVVPEQAEPDGHFPTCPYPNPEEKKALTLGLELSQTEQPDLLIATDPDCDRVGIAVNTGDCFELLNGNEVGVLLFDFICKRLLETGALPAAPVAITTIVSTDMAYPIAKKYGVALWRVLTGFKFIGEQIGLLEERGEKERFLFGFEESYGYLSGTAVRDKDAVNASLLICDMARYYKEKGQTLWDAMEILYAEHGFYQNGLVSLQFDGPQGLAEMNRLLETIRNNPPKKIGGLPVKRLYDYATGSTGTLENPCVLPPSNVLEFQLEANGKLLLRPSGTEPKMKLYGSVCGENKADAHKQLDILLQAGKELLQH